MPPPDDLAKQIAETSPSALTSPTRSTVPLLSVLRYDSAVFEREVGALLGGSPEAVTLEHAVPVKKGRGKASFTDAMVRGAGRALAVEAKWTEPHYESVAKWLRGGTNARNRELVLEGWLEHLEDGTGVALEPVEPTPAFGAIAALPKGKATTGEQVKAALLRERLFTTAGWTTTRV